MINPQGTLAHNWSCNNKVLPDKEVKKHRWRKSKKVERKREKRCIEQDKNTY